MYAKSILPSAEREVQIFRTAQRDDGVSRSGKQAAPEAHNGNWPARRADILNSHFMKSETFSL